MRFATYCANPAPLDTPFKTHFHLLLSPSCSVEPGPFRMTGRE